MSTIITAVQKQNSLYIRGDGRPIFHMGTGGRIEKIWPKDICLGAETVSTLVDRGSRIGRKEVQRMENVEIARVLEQYADLLDIRAENPFRVRSYRKAAQTVAGLSRPVAQLIEAGEDLTTLPGIGSSMAEHLKEIVETGKLTALGEVRREFPETLTELMRLETLGPKKARKLYDELGITSVSELAAAIDAGKVEAMSGFGKKTAENLRRAIAQLTRNTQRFLLADADQLIQPLLTYLREGPDVEVLEVAGSYRRRKETVGDIDLLVTCENPQPLMQYFQSYPYVEHVEMAGTTRGTIVLRSGLQVDLRIVPRRSYSRGPKPIAWRCAHSASNAACASTNMASSVSPGGRRPRSWETKRACASVGSGRRMSSTPWA